MAKLALGPRLSDVQVSSALTAPWCFLIQLSSACLPHASRSLSKEDWWANATWKGKFQLSTAWECILECLGKSSICIKKAIISQSLWVNSQLTVPKRFVCRVSYKGLAWPIRVSIWDHFSAPLVLCKGLLSHIIADVNKMIIVSVRAEMDFYLCCWCIMTWCHEKTQGNKAHILFLVKDKVRFLSWLPSFYLLQQDNLGSLKNLWLKVR